MSYTRRRPLLVQAPGPAFDPNRHNVFGQPIKPKPYRPPQVTEVARMEPPAPIAEQVQYQPGVGIPYAVTEEVVRHTVHYVWPIVPPTVEISYQASPREVDPPVAHESGRSRLSLPATTRGALLWLVVGSGLGALLGILVGVLVAILLL